MTPEEKAVIEAAMAGNGIGSVPTTAQGHALRQAVHALIFACPECNAGGHTCQGDGNPIGHTQTDCGEHEEPDEMDKRTADTLPCWECLTDPTEDPAPWCDCRELGERCKGPCRERAHAPERCPNLSPAWRKRQEPEWVPATLSHCLAGDHIRIGTDETDVIRTDGGRVWHADNTDPYRPKPWKHIELRMELAANPGFQEYPPNTSCEILCTPERKVALLMQQTFSGSTVISSDVD